MCGHLRGTLAGSGSQHGVYLHWCGCYMVKVEAHIRKTNKNKHTKGKSS